MSDFRYGFSKDTKDQLPNGIKVELTEVIPSIIELSSKAVVSRLAGAEPSALVMSVMLEASCDIAWVRCSSEYLIRSFSRRCR